MSPRITAGTEDLTAEDPDRADTAEEATAVVREDLRDLVADPLSRRIRMMRIHLQGRCPEDLQRQRATSLSKR